MHHPGRSAARYGLQMPEAGTQSSGKLPMPDPGPGPLCLKMRGARQAAKERMSMENNADAAFRLQGRHALVTGGASGIGESTVKELVCAGAFVWVADINLPAAEQLAASTGSAKAIHLDVT